MFRARVSAVSKADGTLGRVWRSMRLPLCFSAIFAAACQSPSLTLETPQDVADAVAALPDPSAVSIVLTAENGVPEFVRGPLGRISGAVQNLSLDSASSALQPALGPIAAIFRLDAGDVRPHRVQRSADQNVHVRLQQLKHGLPVVGGDLILHIATDGQIYAANGTAQGAAADMQPPSSPNPTLAPVSYVYYRDANAKLHLAETFVRSGVRDGAPFSDVVYRSVQTGQELAAVPQIYTVMPMRRTVFSADSAEVVPGRLIRNEGDAPSGDMNVDGNYELLADSHRCYDSLFGRASYDDAGSPILSTVHYGRTVNNAFSNGINIMFGDGDGARFSELGLDGDIVTHELTHSATAHTARLEYMNESGALNESMSDVAAAACNSWLRGRVLDATVWKLGEDAFTPGTAGDALRYMDNPTRDRASRDYYPERYRGADDNGGVHWNSGIPNLAFYLLTEGGSHPRGKTTNKVAGVGIYKASQIWFTALFYYMSDRTDMRQARAYTVQAAIDSLYPTAIVNSVNAAWDAVGVK